MIKNRRFFELVAGIDRATVVVVAVVVSISFQQPTDCAAAFSPLYLLSISFLPFPLSLTLSSISLFPSLSPTLLSISFPDPLWFILRIVSEAPRASSESDAEVKAAKKFHRQKKKFCFVFEPTGKPFSFGFEILKTARPMATKRRLFVGVVVLVAAAVNLVAADPGERC